MGAKRIIYIGIDHMNSLHHSNYDEKVNQKLQKNAQNSYPHYRNVFTNIYEANPLTNKDIFNKIIY